MRSLCCFPALLGAILAAAAPALSQGSHVSSEGQAYSLACDRSGLTLTSQAPVARFEGRGGETKLRKRVEVLRFARDCTAALDVAGPGRWGWSDGGFGAEFSDGLRVMFPRQTLSCDPLPAFVAGCRW